MRRLIKLLFLLAVLGGVGIAASYAGAFARAGSIVGPSGRALGTRQVTLAYRGVERLPNKPIAWVFTYGPTDLPGVRQARIYISPLGQILATEPRDLDARLEAWRRAQTP